MPTDGRRLRFATPILPYACRYVYSGHLDIGYLSWTPVHRTETRDAGMTTTIPQRKTTTKPNPWVQLPLPGMTA